MKQLVIFIFLLFLVSVINLEAQKIKYIYESHNPNRFTTIKNIIGVQFIDTIENEIIKEIFLRDNNYYENLEFSNKKHLNPTLTKYTIDTNNRSDMNLINKYMSKYDNNYNKSNLIIMTSFNIDDTININSVCIVNQFSVVDEYDVFMKSRRSTVNVYDNMGNNIFNLNDINTDCWNATVSNNNKYVAYYYGNEVAHQSEKVEKGIKIIDVEAGKVIHNLINDNTNENISNYENFISFSVAIKGNYLFKHYMFDSETKNIYTATINYIDNPIRIEPNKRITILEEGKEKEVSFYEVFKATYSSEY